MRKIVLSTGIDATPHVYQKNPQPQSECLLDSATKEVDDNLIKKYICKSKLEGIDTRDCPDVMEIWGAISTETKRKTE